MRATNSVSPRRGSKAASDHGGSGETELLRPDVGRGVLVPQDEILREIRHELGNHFHKLYYWADYVTEVGVGTEDTMTSEPLTRTIQNLERFLDLAMDFLQPYALEPIPMSIADLAAAAHQVVEAEVASADVQLEVHADLKGRKVAIDPSRFSGALRVVARSLDGQGAGGLLGYRIRFGESADFRAIEIHLEAPTALGSGSNPEPHQLEWANAQRTMEAHGGSLSPCEAHGGTASVRVVLPWIG